jgi:hypothetical protein
MGLLAQAVEESALGGRLLNFLDQQGELIV